MKQVVTKSCMLIAALLISLSAHAISLSRTALMQRMATARQFTITLRNSTDDWSGRDHVHRMPATTDSVAGIYDVERGQLTIYFNYASRLSSACVFADEELMLGYSRLQTAVGDSVVFDLSTLGIHDYLVTVENKDNGMLLYSSIANDPRILVRSTFEFGTHIYYCNNQPTDSLPPLGYSAAVAYDVYPTFHKDIVSTGGTLSVSAESADADCEVYLFRKDNPEAFSEKFVTTPSPADGVSRGTRSYTLAAGTYLLVVAAATPCKYKHCTVTVDSTTYAGQWLARNYFPFAIQPETSQTVYDSFVRGYSCHPQLLILGGSGEVVAYADNQQTGYTQGWSDNIHIRRSYSTPTTGAMVVPMGEIAPQPGYMLYWPVRLASLYVGCKKMKSTDRSRSHFSTAYRDSVFYASDATVDCDSWSWAAGEWMVADNPLRVLAQDYINDSADDVMRFDSLFARVGYTRDNATQTNSSLDLYHKATDYTAWWHASVKAYSQKYAMGFGWESKMNGRGNRFFHPREAIVTDNTTTVYYYRRFDLGEAMHTGVPPAGFVTFNPGELVFENEELTDDYYDYIFEKTDEGPLGDVIDFDYFYYYADRVMESDTLSSFGAFLQSAEYQALLNFCTTHPAIMYYAFLPGLEGEEAGLALIEDLYAHAYPTVLQQVWTYNRTHKRSPDNKGLRRTRHANAVLFVKTLLDAEMSHRRSEAMPRHDVSYSDDPTAFSVEPQGLTLSIGFDLQRESSVSLSIATPDGRRVAQPLAGERLAAGGYSRQVGVGQSGLYIVTYRENGRIYSRKVVVR